MWAMWHNAATELPPMSAAQPEPSPSLPSLWLAIIGPMSPLSDQQSSGRALLPGLCCQLATTGQTTENSRHRKIIRRRIAQWALCTDPQAGTGWTGCYLPSDRYSLSRGSRTLVEAERPLRQAQPTGGRERLHWRLELSSVYWRGWQ